MLLTALLVLGIAALALGFLWFYLRDWDDRE
jgi:hypothetical protein